MSLRTTTRSGLTLSSKDGRCSVFKGTLCSSWSQNNKTRSFQVSGYPKERPWQTQRWTKVFMAWLFSTPRRKHLKTQHSWRTSRRRSTYFPSGSSVEYPLLFRETPGFDVTAYLMKDQANKSLNLLVLGRPTQESIIFLEMTKYVWRHPQNSDAS